MSESGEKTVKAGTLIKEASSEDLGFASSLWDSESGTRFMARFREAMLVLHHFAAHRGYKHWIITFSGGKDSTTTLVIALEAALNHLDLVERIDVVYSDTGIEIPVIRQYALDFLGHLRCSQRVARLPLHCHVVYPAIEKSFWVCLLGKGYPPPHQRFRWCTRRLKIEPVEEALKAFIQPDKSIVLTGVRFGESQSRDGRLNYSCNRGGECGQGIWFQYNSRLSAGYLAPIAYWRECDVWDFLNFYAPDLGYPTQHLETSVYNGRETRFGCWMCTVVRQDKTMEKITLMPQWAHLRPLLEFRQHVKAISNSPNSRILRPDGKPGRLKLSVRQHLLDELLQLQNQLGMNIISYEEIVTIKELWQKEESNAV
jgi:DNA sulfur modification protein DndC